MLSANIYESLFVIAAFLIQIILCIHFAMRKWHYDAAIRYGWIVYTLGIPAAAMSIFGGVAGMSWVFCIGGFLYLVWGLFGYTVEYILHIQWRDPINWVILGPYITLYLAMLMFYWWPLAFVDKPCWYIYGFLFLLSTYLNISSHHKKGMVVDGRV